MVLYLLKLLENGGTLMDKICEYLNCGKSRSFSETLFYFIDKNGRKDSEVYKNADVDRKLFSKIRCLATATLLYSVVFLPNHINFIKLEILTFCRFLGDHLKLHWVYNL